MERSVIVGLGFDCKDGQRRITLAENYKLYGGSKKTHEMMREKCVKFNEQLRKRCKTLDEINTEEFFEIAYKTGFCVPRRKRFLP